MNDVKFMEVQSGLISLCMELVGKIADVVYAWCSLEDDSYSFNLFVNVNGEFKTLGTLNLDQQLLDNCLDMGTMDTYKIVGICKKYCMPIPTEIRMVYDVKTGKFDAKYCYEPLYSYDKNKSEIDVFMAWLDEMKQG